MPSTAWRLGYEAGRNPAAGYRPVQPVHEYARGYARGVADRPKEAPMQIDQAQLVLDPRDRFDVKVRDDGEATIRVSHDNWSSLVLDSTVDQLTQLRDAITDQIENHKRAVEDDVKKSLGISA